MTKRKLFVAMPLYGRMHRNVARAFHNADSAQVYVDRPHEVHSSLLAYNCNIAWAKARRDGFDDFLMMHSDVLPVSHTFIDELYERRDAVDADVLGTVIAISTTEGMSSSAWSTQGDPWKRYADGDRLLVNTGLMLVRITRGGQRQPWVNKTWFEINDKVDEDDEVYNEPEDWYFSRRAAEEGARVYATTAIRTIHYGEIGFPNWATSSERPKEEACTATAN